MSIVLNAEYPLANFLTQNPDVLSRGTLVRISGLPGGETREIVVSQIYDNNIEVTEWRNSKKLVFPHKAICGLNLNHAREFQQLWKQGESFVGGFQFTDDHKYTLYMNPEWEHPSIAVVAKNYFEYVRMIATGPLEQALTFACIRLVQQYMS